jgi:hypothetical protein
MKIVQEDTGEVQDLLDKAAEAPYNTILRVWLEILLPAKEEKLKNVTPQWANRIVSNYQGIRFADMDLFRDLYFAKVLTLADILADEIDSDEECLNVSSPAEDSTLNHHHYLTVLFNWQQRFLLWELAWRTTDPDAAVELAALSEVHKMFFAEQGLTSLLDQINFEFTDEHRQMLADLLQETKDSEEDR